MSYLIGVGKTTFTRHLYDHERICDKFDKRIWICVSQNFNIIRLLNEMVESVTSSNLGLKNMETIKDKLQEKLKGKKLLVVLDDVWNNEQGSWRLLKEWLDRIETRPGSMILINTRNDEVAKAAKVEFRHKLKGLSTDKSWSLLERIVSNNGTLPINSSLVKVGKRIIEKCNGVPLAIKVTGGLLQSKQDLHEWELIERSGLWNLPLDQNQMLPSLLLSYNHLPSTSVKQCFAYCAIVPKGTCIFKNQLIGLWSSQGYLLGGERNNRTMEEIGEENLKILVSNSLIECVSTKSGILSYRMHEFVSDCAVYVCGSDFSKKAEDLLDKGNCRHLVFKSVKKTAISDFHPEALSKLRTLCIMGTDVPWDMLTKTRYLRTLKLDRAGIKEVPPTIDGRLNNLRFLDLSFNDISTLPDSIGELYKLQMLILQDCTNMKRLPNVVYKLANLRHILTTAPMVAGKGLQQLTNLQTLPNLPLGNDEDGWTVDELGDLRQLRDEIHIFGLECVKDKDTARKAGLVSKAYVTKLNLCWAEERGKNIGGNCDEDVLEGLEPHPNITSLEVHNFLGVIFPIWLRGMTALAQGRQLKSLTMVKLLNCSKCQTLPKLGHLPLLKCLILSGFCVEFIGMEFYGGDDLNIQEAISFQCLIELDISGFRRLTTWIEPPKAAFPGLKTVHIRDCGLLKAIPMFLKSLVSVELENHNDFKSLAILELENPNDSKSLATLEPGNLNSMVSLDDSREGWSIDERGDLHGFNDEIYLRRLECVKNKTTAKKIGLAQKVHVTKLSLSWGTEREETSGDEDVLEGLEPHPNITSLEVQNFLGVRFPTWIKGMAVLTQGQIRGSLTELTYLTTVKLLNCSKCQALPKLGQLPLLKCLILSGLDVEYVGIEFYGGDDLDFLGVVSFQCLLELEISVFCRLTRWADPPQAAFPNLKALRIKDCGQLKSVPAFKFKSLTSLELEGLRSVESLEIIKYSSGLTSLIMKSMPKLASLPKELANCTKLQTIVIRICRELVSLPKGLDSLINLQSIEIVDCVKLKFVMYDLLHVSSSLRVFEIIFCASDLKIPSRIEECTLLETLKIQSSEFRMSPTQISKLPCLEELFIECHSEEYLKSMLEAVKDLSGLKTIEIFTLTDEEKIKECWSDVNGGSADIKTIPKQLGLLTRIELLELYWFSELEEMTPWICNMSSLRYLLSQNCDKLNSIPSKEELSNLVSLKINYCKLLKERYSKNGGYEWHKISDIREIIMDYKAIQPLDE